MSPAPQSQPPFAHLHVASGYSLRYGASSPAALVRQAVAHGQQVVALTDRDGLYGAVRFAIACREAGIAPVLGVDVAVAPSGLLPTPTEVRTRRTPARGGAWVDQALPRHDGPPGAPGCNGRQGSGPPPPARSR